MSNDNTPKRNASSQDGNEKKTVYEQNFGRYKKAKSNGFYLECLWILYAYLEDRSSAFLYHVGFTSQDDRKKVSKSKFIKRDVRILLGLTDDKNVRYKLFNLSDKLDRIKRIWNFDYDNLCDKDEYLSTLKKVVNGAKNKEEYLKSLEYLQNQWRQERNELTHALFRKECLSQYEELLPIIEAGYDNVRIFDNMVRFVKNKKIRERFKVL